MVHGMNIKKMIGGLLMIWLMSLLGACANIIPPDGGARDSLPPRLMISSPKDSATNISPKLITLQFDEYINVQNINDNLIVSPTIKSNPLVDYKLRTVTIKLKDSLDANTTYSLNFGNAIKDINESNILKNFTYVFSTGKTIDSLRYKGKVLLAETGKTDSTLLVILHKNLADTAISKERPRYYTRINGKGEFIFKNLSPGKYRAFVLPNDYTKKYDDSVKIFAFKSDILTVSANTPLDTLYAYQEFKIKEKPVKPTAVVDKIGKVDKRLKYQTNLENGQQDILNNLQLTFNRKIILADSMPITLCDTNFTKLTGFTVQLDTAKTKLIIQHPWKEMNYYRLLIPKNALSDTGGITLIKSDTLKFNTKRESDYGSIKIRFTNIQLAKHPVLQFILSNKLIESVALTSFEITRKLFAPGAYELRILYDTNQNGVWDTGSFWKQKKQPEIVQLIPQTLNVKANWDNEVTINL